MNDDRDRLSPEERRERLPEHELDRSTDTLGGGVMDKAGTASAGTGGTAGRIEQGPNSGEPLDRNVQPDPAAPADTGIAGTRPGVLSPDYGGAGIHTADLDDDPDDDGAGGR